MLTMGLGLKVLLVVTAFLSSFLQVTEEQKIGRRCQKWQQKQVAFYVPEEDNDNCNKNPSSTHK